VRVHPFFWLVAALLGYKSNDLGDVLVWIVALFVAILFHELGHAVVTRTFGFRPWIVLYGMGGLTCWDPTYRAGGRRMTTARHILISLAGPLAGFLLAAAVAGAIILAGHGDQLRLLIDRRIGIHLFVLDIGHARLQMLINDAFMICVFWGLINLLPIFPLDGGQIARDVFLAASPYRGYRQSLMLSFATAVLLAAVGALVWHSWFIGIMFGYMAYMSYMALQLDSGRGER
jgi:Zn-dependent protease